MTITAHALRPGDRVHAALGSWSEGEVLQVREPLELVVRVADCAS